MINLEDFKKLDLRIAKIASAEKVDGSEKLLRLEVDLGEEKLRQIISGIAKSYNPEDLINRQIIVIANLEPRLIVGLESQAMLLAVDNNGQILLLSLDTETEPGSKVC